VADAMPHLAADQIIRVDEGNMHALRPERQSADIIEEYGEENGCYLHDQKEKLHATYRSLVYLDTVD
jgi:hypothetical protein